MGGKHLFVLGVLIQLLIFIEPQVGGAKAEALVSVSIKNESNGVGVEKVKDTNPGNVIHHRSSSSNSNNTRSKLWSPYSTVSNLLSSTTIYEDHHQQQQLLPNQKSVVNQVAQQQEKKQLQSSTSYHPQGPLISNIRHYKSRKSFSRVKTISLPPPQLPPVSQFISLEEKKVEIEHDHDWQGDEPIPTTLPLTLSSFHSKKNTSSSSSSSSKNSRNESDTSISISKINVTSTVYGKPRLKQTPGKVLIGNFTRIDRIKTLLYQNKNLTFTTTSSSIKLPSFFQNSQGVQILNNTQLYNKNIHQNLSKNIKHKNIQKLRRKINNDEKRKSFKKNENINHNFSSSSSGIPFDYQSVSVNQNYDDEYYEIGEAEISKTTSNNNDSPIFVPGIFPTFYEDINNNHEDKIETTYDDTGNNIVNGSSHDSFDPEKEELEEKAEMDIVSRFLRIIEERTPENCTAGVNLTLGQGVVDRYAQDRFRLEAGVAVNRANMLTRLWKYAPHVMESEYLLHASLFSIIEFDDDIFAAGNCYDGLEYKNYKLFCPFAHRVPDGDAILVKDLALEYNYLTNASEFFFGARKNAERIISNFSQFRKGYHYYPHNDTAYGTERSEDIILNVTYEDGKWSMPYFDCGGGNIWMMTYTVPFFGFRNSKYYFKGTSGIDIDLRRVDIDQCPIPENSTELNIFSSSDKCKPSTTKCVPIKGLGFRRGSYRCECRGGFYFPNISSPIKYFNGALLEEEYENKFMRKFSRYDEKGAFECLECPSGCDVCEDDRPCVVTLNWLMRTAILILQSAIILMLPLVGLFTWKYSEVKVVRAASPLLLRFIVLGAFFIYCTTLVMYPSPSVITCTLQVWLREIGFSLAYGALMLKTWRISVIFRVRSAKAVKITDLDLMKRLGMIVGMFTVLLAIRTLVAPPVSIVSLTSDDLKAWLCKSDWWDHSFTIMELSFLVWGIRLCIVVRKAPSEFNESKFISLAIYNEFLLSLFLNISMLFLQSPANPDLLYIIFFCHVQLTMTLLLCLIFGSKAYMVFRGHGKGGSSSDEFRPPTAKFINKGRAGHSATSKQNSTGMNCRFNASISMGHEQTPILTVPEDVQEEFRRLYSQLEELKERNMRLGNRHLVAKITAMQEAADNMLSGNSASTANDAQNKQVVVAGNSCSTQETVTISSCSEVSFSAVIPSQGGSCTSNPKGKSMGILSDISEDENPSSFTGTTGGTRVEAAKTERLEKCRTTADNAASVCALSRSIPPQTLYTSNSKALPNLETTTSSTTGEGETPSSSKGEIASPSENEVQVGDDELLDRDLNIDEEEDEPQVTLITNDSNGDCDNEGDVLDSTLISNLHMMRNAKGSSTNSSSTPAYERKVEDEALEKQTEIQKQQSNSIVEIGILQEPQDVNSMNKSQPTTSSSIVNPTTTTTTSSTTEESSPSKMILDLNDKSRFTEEITV